MVVRAGPEQSHPRDTSQGSGEFQLCLWGREKVLGGREMCSPESPLARDRAGPRASKWLPCFAHALSCCRDGQRQTMRLYPGEPTPHVEIGDEGHSVPPPQKD